MLDYEARSHFVGFHQRRQRWAVLNTHRRAGKTVALVNDLLEKAMMCQGRKPQHAYVGPTFTQAKRIAWAYLKDYSEHLWSKPASESELRVNLHGDRTIYCLGADNPDSLRGMYLDGAVMDEYALWRPSVFSTIIRPALSDRNGWGVFASTPRGKNLFYSEYKRALKDKAYYYNLTLRASESGIIHPLELEALRKDMDPEEYAQEYECSFDAALKGAIYAEEINLVFAESRVRLGLYDSNLPTHVVFDLGFTDATVAIYWQEAPDGTIRLVNVEATNGKDIFHHIDRIVAFKGQGELGSVWLPHDAKARNLQTGKSIVEQFLDNDIRPSMVPGHKVRDRISATRLMFPRVHIEEECSEDLLEALKGYRREWDENKLMFSDTPLHDWCADYADAFGYMCVVCAPKYGRLNGADMLSPSPAASATPLRTDYNLHHLFQDRDDSLRRQGRRIS
jgi:phage terminase large subunit